MVQYDEASADSGFRKEIVVEEFSEGRIDGGKLESLADGDSEFSQGLLGLRTCLFRIGFRIIGLGPTFRLVGEAS